MLHRSLTEQAAGCFYGDKQLAERLWQALLQEPDSFGGWPALQEECFQLLVEGVDARNPREYRLTDIRHLMGVLCTGDLLLTGELPWLGELFSRLFTRNGDLLCYRETQVQAYVRIAAELDPTLLVAWHLCDWLQQSPAPSPHDIQRVLSAQTAFFAPPGNPELLFAEGHVHFGGITADSAILDDYLFAGRELTLYEKASPWHQQQHQLLLPQLDRVRRLLALLLAPLEKPVTNGGQEKYHSSMQAYWLRDPMRNGLSLPDWPTMAAMYATASLGSSEWLLRGVALAMEGGHANRWLWLLLYLCRRYRSKETLPLERTAILCFWQTFNGLRRSLIMDGQGLTRFAEHYYNSNLGRGTESRHDNLRRLFHTSGDVVEIKSGPNSFSPKFSQLFSKGLLKQSGLSQPTPPYIFGEHEIRPNANAQTYLQTLERWQFCGHFSRTSRHERGKRPKANCKDLWKTTRKLLNKLNNQSGWNDAVFLGGKLNPHFHFQPARWFRGLDVAGDENALKIEWFSPMLRWLRSGLMGRSEGESASTGFHLSIHAGEDYAHPASGLRHIDETVRFCEFRDGDRLGHALALGIEPTFWVERQGDMLLPLDEHLDNLVWLWHYAVELSGRLLLAQQVLPLLERRIARFSRELSGWRVPHFGYEFERDDRSLSVVDSPSHLGGTTTPDTLYRAWLLRQNCHYTLRELHGGQPLTARERSALPDWRCLMDNNDEAVRLYLNRHSYLESGQELPLVMVRFSNSWQGRDSLYPEQHGGTPHSQNTVCRVELFNDTDTPAELEFMHALQDYLLDRYESMGLIIEANPTSNVYIARLKQHSEHPIFRWHPPEESVLVPGGEHNRHNLRRGPIRVLVNTDDPGIMPTTLRTEFLLLREAALERGIGRTIAERWLETLRQYGIEQFHRNHLPVFEQV